MLTRFRAMLAPIVVVLALGASAPSAAAPFDAIYVLGDSLSDQGNLLLATRTVAGPSNALPDPLHYFNGRFSNGPVYTDYLSQQLGLPLGPSLAGGNNFAFGGARTSYNVVEQQAGGPFPNGLFPWSLNREVQAFNARGVHDSNALFIVFSGSNDIADILTRSLDPTVVIPNVIAGIMNAVQAFVNAGATTILVPNIPDLGLTPAFNGLGPPAVNPASRLSRQFNNALDLALDTVIGPHIIEFQTDDLLQAVVDHPAAFGLTNVKNPCYSGFVVPNPAATECPNPQDFLFWDVVHPTTAVHAALAREILVAVPEPPTLLLVIGAFLIVASWRGVRPVRLPGRGE